MISNRFALFLIGRVALLTLALLGFSLAFIAQGYYGLTGLLGGVALLIAGDLYRVVSSTNAELARFFDSLRYDDFNQCFEPIAKNGGSLRAKGGANFDTLLKTFNELMKNFKISRQDQEESLRHLKSLTDHLPIPLLSLYGDGRIQLQNNAARRLFGRVNVNKIDDLHVFGRVFGDAISELEPGSRRLVNFSYDGVQRQLAVAVTHIQTHTRSGTIGEKLISLQDIQSELDSVQLQAWQDLVRVLTHEIMNSITPVASLAKTAVELVEDVQINLKKKHSSEAVEEDLADVQRAVSTVARRSDGLMQFVQSYRSLTVLSVPEKQPVLLGEMFERVKVLFAVDWKKQGITLSIKAEPADLQVHADPGMLEQVFINLLHNAEQAMVNVNPRIHNPHVSLSARVNQMGYVLVEVSDNGPGVPDKIMSEIFVPFFTTKREGSGVGLALTRQIMIAHGGSVSVGVANESKVGVGHGAKFTLIF